MGKRENCLLQSFLLLVAPSLEQQSYGKSDEGKENKRHLKNVVERIHPNFVEEIHASQNFYWSPDYNHRGNGKADGTSPLRDAHQTAQHEEAAHGTRQTDG